MNKSFIRKILLILAIVIINSMMVFAAPGTDASDAKATVDKETIYFEKSKSIKLDIDNLNTQIKEINAYNIEVNNRLDELNELYKIDKSIISYDTMRKIKDIRRTIKDTGKKEKNIAEEESVSSLVQKKEYDKALERLNGILEEKREQYKDAEKKNAMWKEIDSLIS